VAETEGVGESGWSDTERNLVGEAVTNNQL
jgi:hypothetical protein